MAATEGVRNVKCVKEGDKDEETSVGVRVRSERSNYDRFIRSVYGFYLLKFFCVPCLLPFVYVSFLMSLIYAPCLMPFI